MQTQTPNTHQAQMLAYQASNPHLDMAPVLMSLMGQVKGLPLRPQDEALLQDTEPFRFGPGDSRQAWSIGQGPLVMLVHGYSGRGVQMATLARHIAAGGFRCVFFDAGGHGFSAPERLGFHTFINDSHALWRNLDTPVHAMIGHSAGGLAMMRARELYGIHAQRYGVISAPLFPYIPLETMRTNGATDSALEYVKAVLSDQFQMPWSKLAKGASFLPEGGRRFMAIYDQTDKLVTHKDGDALGEIWQGAEIVKTSGYGHNRILQATETLTALRRFVED